MATRVEQKGQIVPNKWEVTYEDEDSISILRYNTSKSSSGPFEVEYKWKKTFNPWDQKKKTLGDLVKEEKKKRSVRN